METIDVLVQLPKSVLSATKVRRRELGCLLRQSLAIELFRGGVVTIGKAAEIAGITTKWEMLGLLSKHEIFLDYSADDAEHDLQTLKSLKI